MKKILVLGMIVLSAFILGSCGQADRMEAQITGYSSRCINGVLYYQFSSGVTVAYNQDGTVKKCK